MLQQVQCMVSIKNYLSENLIKQIDKHSFMLSQKTNELMAHTWSHLYKIPTTGLSFLQFMVHGEDQIWHFSNSLKIYFKEKNISS